MYKGNTSFDHLNEETKPATVKTDTTIILNNEHESSAVILDDEIIINSEEDSSYEVIQYINLESSSSDSKKEDINNEGDLNSSAVDTLNEISIELKPTSTEDCCSEGLQNCNQNNGNIDEKNLDHSD